MSGRVGVVIVTYNSGEVIERCLASCRGLETVVVDNASTDDTVTRSRGVRLITNTTNRGFAAAVNQGVRALDTKSILLLNPDVELQGPVERLSEADLATGQLLGNDGNLQRGFGVRRLPTPWSLIFEVLGINRMLPANPVNSRYRAADLDLSQQAEVEQPAGAFLMFQRSVWERLGGFDEQFYPLWFEDVDFCRRALDAGYKIRYIPQIKATHRGGHSVAHLDWSNREVYWYVSLLKYACKHFGPRAFRGVCGAVVLGSVFRALIGVVRRRSSEPLLTYARVMRVAAFSAVRRQMPEAFTDASVEGTKRKHS